MTSLSPETLSPAGSATDPQRRLARAIALARTTRDREVPARAVAGAGFRRGLSFPGAVRLIRFCSMAGAGAAAGGDYHRHRVGAGGVLRISPGPIGKMGHGGWSGTAALPTADFRMA